MTRSIVGAAVLRPAYRRGPVCVEGPDEDAFTMAVAAAERLVGRAATDGPPVDSIHLVGEFPSEADLGLPEALDAPNVAVERHGTGLPGLGAAFAAAARGGEAGSSLVLVADVARLAPSETSVHGAGAVAFELRSGPGWSPSGHGGRRHPPHRAPDARGWLSDGLRHSGIPPSGAVGSLYFLASEAPPVLLAFWRKAHPTMEVVLGASAPQAIGAAPSLAAAQWVLEVAARPGEWAVVAEVGSEESRFLGLHRTGPVEQWESLAPVPELPSLPAPPRGVGVGALAAVSEGAYVPRARYLENLPSRWRLVAERCAACHGLTFPARGRCRGCGRTDGLTAEALPRSGTVLAATVVAPGAHPTEFDPLVAIGGGYGVVLVELAPSVRATLQVADHGPEPLAPGSRVTTALRRLYPMEGEWRYGRKALAAPPSA